MFRQFTLASVLAAVVAVPAAFAQDEVTAPETEAEAPDTPDTPETEAGAEAGTPADADADASAEAPVSPNDLSMGVADGDQPGAPYTRAEFGAWEQRCLRVEDGPEPCTIYQLLEDEDGNPVAEVGLFPVPEGAGDAAAGANFVAPMETLLPAGLRLAIDGGEARTYPFTFCSSRGFSPLLSSGCLARVGFDQATVDRLKRGATAQISIVPALAPDEVVNLTMSLSGFTAAFDLQTEAVPEPVE